MIFYFNFVLAIIFFVYFSWKTTRKGIVLSPHMIMWGMPLLILLVPGILTQPHYLDEPFNHIITAGLLGTMIGSFIFKIPALNKKITDSPSTIINTLGPVDYRYELPRRFIRIGAMVYGLYLGGSIMELVIRHGGFIEVLFVRRMEYYLSGGILEGGAFISLLMFLPAVLYYMYIGRMLYFKRYLIAFFLTLLISLFYVFTANTRLPMIMPLIAMGMIIISDNVPYKRLPTLLPLLIVVGFAFVFSFNVIGNLIRGGKVDNINEVFENFQHDAVGQLEVDLNYIELLNDFSSEFENDNHHLDLGRAWVFYGPISLIPRFIWPDKPITSTSNRLTEIVYNRKIGDGSPVATFTIYAEGYFQGHYLGAFISPILFFAIYNFLIKKVGQFKYSEYWIAMILLQMATFFRAELPIPQFIFTLILLSLFRYIRL